MSKEIIRPNQFAAVHQAALDESLESSSDYRAELSELYADVFESLVPGKLVKGTVVRIDNDGILVDIEYKSEGLIPRYEFSPQELKQFKVGDSIEVILDELENIDGNVLLSYEKAKALRAWDEITKLYEEGKPVQGVVTHKVKGGLNVDIRIPAFLPGSQIALQRVTDFDKYVGQTIVANIIKINRKRGNVILSRRKYLTDQRTETRQHIIEVLSEGQVIQGTVKNITNYGVFIDIGGVDGLLHITDMTWGRISHPSELVKLGDVITVKVLSFDKENEKISLGLKQLTENPWQAIADTLKPGDRVTGKISSITDYGLFVEVQKGVEGLVHISEISWTSRINDLTTKYSIGQEIEAVIVSIDIENRRMSLSIKQIQKNPWESVTQQFTVGQKITGTVSNITDFGIFIQLLPGVDGLVHISDFSWTEHIDHPGSIYKKGDTVEAVILNIDLEKKKISLGIKQLASDPWENIEQKYPVSSIIEGEVSKITNFGAFVRLASGIEGLVHISELSQHGKVDHVQDVLKVGHRGKFRVISVSQQEHKLGLSLQLEAPAPREAKVHQTQESTRAKEKESFAKEATKESAKPKSLLQIALEEHAARSDNNDEN